MSWQLYISIYGGSISWDDWNKQTPRLQEFMLETQKELKDLKLNAMDNMKIPGTAF